MRSAPKDKYTDEQELRMTDYENHTHTTSTPNPTPSSPHLEICVKKIEE